MDFAPTPLAAEYHQRVAGFIAKEIEPIEGDYLRSLRELADPWVVLPIIDELKAKAREQGL